MMRRIIGMVIFGGLLAAGCSSETSGTGGAAGLITYSQQYRQQVFISTDHPYANNTLRDWEIQAPEGTVRFKVHFSRFETERYYDQVLFLDASGQTIFRLSGNHSDEEFLVQGDYVKIRFLSDASVTDWGFNIDYYTYVVEEDHPVDHRPYCGAVGSRSEGWYWGDTGELIKYAHCAEAGEPECVGIGSRSEGWSAEGAGLIVWDNCHRTVRIALAGEACGPSIGFSCYDDLYCEGLPSGGRLGGTGTCRAYGYCDSDDDCAAEGNVWVHDSCEGFAVCDRAQTQCTWRCQADQDGPWSWSHHLLQGIESEHPYQNSYTHTWTIHEPGASKIKLHFTRLDMERGYDWVAVAANGQAPVYYDGQRGEFWTSEFDGDTVAVTIHTDRSVTKWGFKVGEVAFYSQLASGMCNVDEDCGPAGKCYPNMCINPYAPCPGYCGRDDHCDDGQILSCRRAVPECPEGTIVAIKDGCYECVDPETCQVPSTDGDEGARCDDSHGCNEGLFCKNVVNGVGTCQGETWCDSSTVNADCANVVHIMVPGTWTCNDHHCAWQAGMAQVDATAQDTPLAIPDNDSDGVTSHVTVAGMMSCAAPQVAVDLSIRHTYRSDLRVVLEDPNGAQVVLFNRSGGSADDLVLSGFGIAGLGGQGLNGTWQLHVMDLAALDVGTLQSWTLHVSCR